MLIKTLTVSALNTYIKKIMDSDVILNNIHVKGEISNFKVHTSGHIYFSLKDENSKVNAVMFRDKGMLLNFTPKNGMEVEVKGRVGTFVRDGSYQVYVDEIVEYGIGELYIAFNKLKEKLEAEGLFSELKKKEIEKYPVSIGVITSNTGAAIRDILNTIKRRNKSVNIIVYSSLVQGENAPFELIKGIEYFNSNKNVDTIILARGGGSIEELWAFNNEALANSIYNSKIPIVTGIGHETDFTIADFVADKRASTPTAAAEISVKTLDELNSNINKLSENLFKLVNNDIKIKRSNLNMINKTLNLYAPLNTIVNSLYKVDEIVYKFNVIAKNRISREREKLIKYNSLLNAFNPLNILNKGYSIIVSEEKVMSSVDDFKVGINNIEIKLKDGEVKGSLKLEEING